jgi:hypothetical protein
MQLRRGREGSNSGESDKKLLPGERHRVNVVVEASDSTVTVLEGRFGADVPDTQARAEKLREQARARADVSRALVPLTPDYLRIGRQEAYNPNPSNNSAQNTDTVVQNFDPAKTVDFIPVPGMFDMTDTQMPMPPQNNVQDMQGPAAVGSQQ